MYLIVPARRVSTLTVRSWPERTPLVTNAAGIGPSGAGTTGAHSGTGVRPSGPLTSGMHPPPKSATRVNVWSSPPSLCTAKRNPRPTSAQHVVREELRATVRGASAAQIGTSIAMAGVMFGLILHFQYALGWSPMRAGLANLPIILTMILGTPVSERLTERSGTVSPASSAQGCSPPASRAWPGPSSTATWRSPSRWSC